MISLYFGNKINSFVKVKGSDLEVILNEEKFKTLGFKRSLFNLIIAN